MNFVIRERTPNQKRLVFKFLRKLVKIDTVKREINYVPWAIGFSVDHTTGTETAAEIVQE